ncbi:CpaF family protein [bacterium]|nr:CpaF family protein [bacterium]NCQ55776.1 CpaF family protein [Candidatus Parcubacteria bacterium]NCS67725.1 CpaF family protein [Candidatus Peregrinibacteria bacterium]NCS96739.1 CpaF family protein [bacterium]
MKYLDKQVQALKEAGQKEVLAILQNHKTTNPTEQEVRKLCQTFLQQRDTLLPKAIQEEIIDSITYSIVGLGPLEFLLRDDSVSEIMVNGCDNIFVERHGNLEKTSLHFFNEKQLIQVINRIVGQVGRRIDESNPLVDARLLDGSRVNAIIPPLSLKGSSLTIRKFPAKAFTLKDMLQYESCNQAMADFLSFVVLSRQNILVSGGTGAGKTSTLNACASLIPEKERLITIEDSAEIRINHPHFVSLESRNANVEGSGEIPIRQLLKNALRMRPDRIVVGEIRGGEAIDMLQAMNTGHKGSLTTVHANSPLESLYRVETMVLMGDVELPLPAIRSQVIQGIDIVIQQERLPSGKRKITQISEVIKNMRADDYELRPLFWYDFKKECFQMTKKLPDCLRNSRYQEAEILKAWFDK